MTDTERLRINLPLVLPGVDDARDRCVSRLLDLLSGRPGLAEVHIVGIEGASSEVFGDTPINNACGWSDHH